MSDVTDALYALAELGNKDGRLRPTQKCRECKREYYVHPGSAFLVCHCKETPNADGTTSGVVTKIETNQ